MTYGWADQILQPLMGVNYYEQLQGAGYGTAISRGCSWCPA